MLGRRKALSSHSNYRDSIIALVSLFITVVFYDTETLPEVLSLAIILFGVLKPKEFWAVT